LHSELFRDDAENYYYNLVSDNPGAFIICKQEEDRPPWTVIATLNYGEASSYLETASKHTTCRISSCRVLRN